VFYYSAPVLSNYSQSATGANEYALNAQVVVVHVFCGIKLMYNFEGNARSNAEQIEQCVGSALEGLTVGKVTVSPAMCHTFPAAASHHPLPIDL